MTASRGTNLLQGCKFSEATHTLVDDPTPRYVWAAVPRLGEHMTRSCERKAMGGSSRGNEGEWIISSTFPGAMNIK